MTAYLYRLFRFLQFYWHAVTKYQLHSPFVAGLAGSVLEDRRWFYAFRDVERIRRQMLVNAESLADPGREGGRITVRSVARRAASSPAQGRLLFRLAHWAAPRTMLEIGTSLGVGASYLASGMRSARFISLEGRADCARIARLNFETLELKNAEVITGAFEQTLPQALERLNRLDLVFIDGNHRCEPTLQYFETCLSRAHTRTVFVFDDAHWSADMDDAWRRIQNHPQVTLTVDFFELSLAFINPDFREKQHFRILPYCMKPWKVY